jgi:transcriptional regulator with XRE-family HTH domain
MASLPDHNQPFFLNGLHRTVRPAILTGMVSPHDQPTLVRRQLGRRLRRLREESGHAMEDVIHAHIASRTKLWKIESGRGSVKAGDVLALTRLYRTPPQEVEQLLLLAEATRSTGYTEDFGGAVRQSLGLYRELEASATMISAYSSELINGLLQTADYARAVMEADRSLSPEVVNQRVAFREDRQRRFFEHPTSGRLETIITAGVMNLLVGSRSVMEEQIAHLRAVSRKGAARIGVLPATNGVHLAMYGPFVILDFDDPDDPDVVYIENLVGSRYVEKPREVEQFRNAFDEMRRQVLPLEEWLR